MNKPIIDPHKAGDYFNANWDKYKQSVQKNLLYHHEIFSTVDNFLTNIFQTKEFSLADFGCGDGSAIADTLANKSISRYFGIDLAPDLLAAAPAILAKVSGKKQFICENMASAIKKLPGSLDVIFSSYALHHLNYADKVNFIADCQSKLSPNGYFLLVDVVLAKGQNRDDWLEALKHRYVETLTDVPSEKIEHLLEHPRESDFPESIYTYQTIAQQQHWKNFQVLVDKKIYAFMVFSK